MSSKLEECAKLLFTNIYDQKLTQLKSELGNLIAEYDSNGILISSVFFSKLYELTTNAASELSKKRLEIDLEVLAKLGLSISENAQWLKSNQNTLLTETFWKQFVLTEFQRPIFHGRTTQLENQIFNELKNITYRAEREIRALAILPSQAQQEPPNIIINSNAPSQFNIANEQATISASQIINISTEIEEVTKSFIELLKSIDIPSELKNETIDLAEITTEQIKNNKFRPTIIKSFVNKLKSVYNVITSSDNLIRSSGNILEYLNRLNNLLQPFVS